MKEAKTFMQLASDASRAITDLQTERDMYEARLRDVEAERDRLWDIVGPLSEWPCERAAERGGLRCPESAPPSVPELDGRPCWPCQARALAGREEDGGDEEA